MNISIHNYEEFILDFLEGNLSEQKETEMLLFLEQNPHLQSEIDGLLDENLILTADESIIFENKDILKHHDESAMIGFRRIWPPMMLFVAAILAIFAMNKNVWNNSLNINQNPIFSQQQNNTNHLKIDTIVIEDTLCKIVGKSVYLAENQLVIENKNSKNKTQNPIVKSKNLQAEKPTKTAFAIAATSKKASHGNAFMSVAKNANTTIHQTAVVFEKPKQKTTIIDVSATKKLKKRTVSVLPIASLPVRNVVLIDENVTNEFPNAKQAVATIGNDKINLKKQAEKEEILPLKLPLDTEELTSDIVSRVLPKQKRLKNGEFSLLNELKTAFVPEAYVDDTEEITTEIHVSVPVESKSFQFIQKVWKKHQNQ